jgi:hypothetical protein
MYSVSSCQSGCIFPSGFISSIDTDSVVGFAGSRDLVLPSSLCLSVLTPLADRGCSFSVGCASGVDASFLRVLSSRFTSRSSFYRAFSSRSSAGLRIAWTSPDYMTPTVALSVRTRAFVDSCTHIIMFPGDWGRGSRLCARLCRERDVRLIVPE